VGREKVHNRNQECTAFPSDARIAKSLPLEGYCRPIGEKFRQDPRHWDNRVGRASTLHRPSTHTHGVPSRDVGTDDTSLGFELVLNVSLVYALIAITDFLYQRRRFRQEMKMTKQEVKDELKQQEGDMQVKQRIRQIARQCLLKLMLLRVKQADVVVTNPTHYAVALEYERGAMNAPRVVAKGVDYLAEQIRRIARESNVPIVEDPPLARALYASCKVDDEIPESLFRAVARVLAYVYRLRTRARDVG